MFIAHGLSISKLRRQEYDGVSKMRGQFNGLKTLILNENPSVYYVHCFAHQLQLASVVVAKNHSKMDVIIIVIANICNVIGASAKYQDIFQEAQANKILKGLKSGELKTERGLNLEIGFRRAGDTRWSPHYHSMVNLILLYFSVIVTLESIDDTLFVKTRGEAVVLLKMM